jgi:mannose/cellobiose epimerase-like protein (N-acyl-D-glucosamine 2-epimerase family)
VAATALAGLQTHLHDDTHGGWYTEVAADADSADGLGLPVTTKSCYDHVFVLLAGVTAAHAGLDGGSALFDEAEAVFLERFWDDEIGLCRDTWNRDFTVLEPYGGLNANMHAVEAMLAAAGWSQDPAWVERAGRVSRFVIDQAAANEWRIPEHYDTDWRPLLDYNRDRPADQFKPFGATVGHSFEWARLFVHLARAPRPTGGGADAAAVPALEELVEAARRLFDRAVADGWAPDGAPGFVYTVGWDGTPVVRDRLWWVLAEAIAAAATLARQTGEAAYDDLYRRWWDHAAVHHIEADGSWRHQLDEHNNPDTTVWSGKPDLYHVYQAALLPTAPLYPMLATGLAGRA